MKEAAKAQRELDQDPEDVYLVQEKISPTTSMQRMQLSGGGTPQRSHFSPPHGMLERLMCEANVSGGPAWHKHRKLRMPAQLPWLAHLNTIFQSKLKSPPSRIYFSSHKGLLGASRQSVSLPTCHQTCRLTQRVLPWGLPVSHKL